MKSPILRCFFKKDKESKNQEKSSHCLDKMQIHPDTSDAVCAFFLILSQIMQWHVFNIVVWSLPVWIHLNYLPKTCNLSSPKSRVKYQWFQTKDSIVWPTEFSCGPHEGCCLWMTPGCLLCTLRSPLRHTKGKKDVSCYTSSSVLKLWQLSNPNLKTNNYKTIKLFNQLSEIRCHTIFYLTLEIDWVATEEAVHLY